METSKDPPGRPTHLFDPDPPGKPRKSKRKMSEQKKSQSLEEPPAEGFRNGPRPPLSRSKTYDPSFPKEGDKGAVPIHHRNSEPNISNLMKHAVNFHRVFGDLSEDEELIDTFSCAWQREAPYHGRLYVSPHHVCFYCSMIRREVKVIIPVPTITVLKKTNTALLVPNAICIRTTEGEKFLFSSLRSRESAYQLLRSICKHLQDVGQNSPVSPFLMSKETDSNHSLPEHETLNEESDEPDEPVTMPTQMPNDLQEEVANSKEKEQETKASQRPTVHSNPLHAIILIYLVLVLALLLSSSYIGLRIVQLEKLLTSMGAWPELDLQD
ncbi:GRAM domain-containing protein 2A-like isoform X2 [Anolis carolinensis]|uniref:GRAM domain-containing protein 2A-like isoform X2 n=1 Tax=Anolis carolinensis TaxID=28377 RepID=UPI002F2B884C